MTFRSHGHVIVLTPNSEIQAVYRDSLLLPSTGAQQMLEKWCEEHIQEDHGEVVVLVHDDFDLIAAWRANPPDCSEGPYEVKVHGYRPQCVGHEHVVVSYRCGGKTPEDAIVCAMMSKDVWQSGVEGFVIMNGSEFVTRDASGSWELEYPQKLNPKAARKAWPKPFKN